MIQTSQCITKKNDLVKDHRHNIASKLRKLLYLNCCKVSDRALPVEKKQTKWSFNDPFSQIEGKKVISGMRRFNLSATMLSQVLSQRRLWPNDLIPYRASSKWVEQRKNKECRLSPIGKMQSVKRERQAQESFLIYRYLRITAKLEITLLADINCKSLGLLSL